MSAVLVFLAILIASQRLYATNWAHGLELPVLLAILGVSLGLALGASRFSRRAVSWITFGDSLALLPLMAGTILYKKIPWPERMVDLGGRLGYSFYLFATDQPVRDTALFVVLTGIGFWVIGLVAGYSLARSGNFVWAVAPAGLALFIIQLYDASLGDRVVILAIYSFLCLLLLGRMRLVQNRVDWKGQRVALSADSGMDLNLAVMAASLALVLLAWLAPASGRPILGAKVLWDNLTRPWVQAQKDLENAIAGLQGRDRLDTTGFYGDNLPLGQNAVADDTIYLRVRAPMTEHADRYYWRVRAYDQFSGDEWHSVNTFDEEFTPNQRSLALLQEEGVIGEFVFKAPGVNLSTLVTPARPVWISRPAVLSFLPVAQGSLDPLMFRAEPPVLVGEQYSVHAQIFNPTIQQLQAAGSIYPAWVRDNYLQLPENLTPEVIQLANRIVIDSVSPYDKVMAVTEYLRSTITYSKTVEPPPQGVPLLDWFLFDYKAGFCNYYATAEVILLRSLGIPARMVVGFAQGEFEQPDLYIVRKWDAHAWPEVFFPGLGWVEFEPTSGQPPLERAASAETNPAPVASPTPEAAGTEQAGGANLPAEGNGKGNTSARPLGSLARLMIIFIGVVVVGAGLVVAYSSGLLDRILKRTRRSLRSPLPILMRDTMESLALSPPEWLERWAYFAGLLPIQRAFGVVYQGLRWLGTPPSLGRTPAEAAAQLSLLLPERDEQIRSLLVEYQYSLYSLKPGQLVAARRSAEILRREVLRAVLRQRWQGLKNVLTRFPWKKPDRDLDPPGPAG